MLDQLRRVMPKKVNVSSYLQSGPESDDNARSPEIGGQPLPKHDPTYSSLLGFGFRGMPKLLPTDPPPDSKAS